MQDDTMASAVSPDDDVKTASHDHMNRPGVTNGVPDQISEGASIGRPPTERGDAESAAGKAGEGDKTGGGAGS